MHVVFYIEQEKIEKIVYNLWFTQYFLHEVQCGMYGPLPPLVSSPQLCEVG